MTYPILVRTLSEEEGGGYLAEVPDLPGCMGDGETVVEAVADIEGAVTEWIDEAKRRGWDIPEPNITEQYSGKWVMRVPKTLHANLSRRAKQEGVSLNAFASTLLAEGLGKRA